LNYINVTHPSGSKVVVDVSDISRMDMFETKESHYTKIELKTFGVIVCTETPEEINKLAMESGHGKIL